MRPRRTHLVVLSIFLSLYMSIDRVPVAAQTTVRLRGLVDMVAHGEEDLRYLNTTNFRDSNFDPLRARLFVEGGTDRTQIFLQTLFSQESFSSFRLVGAYLLHRVLESRDFYLEAGLIPVHDGLWAPRTYSNKNPLVAIPLAYYWKTSLPAHQMPIDLADLAGRRGQGQHGISYTDSTGNVRGSSFHTAPILYDNCWNYGLYTLGTVGRLEYAVGVTVGSPADPVASSDTNEDLALHAKLGVALSPGLKLYLSAARGAYLSRDVQSFLPEGMSINDYDQNLMILSLDWQWRYVSVTGEYFYNEFETPLRTRDPLDNRSFYVQSVYKLHPGWYIAMRYDELRFGEVDIDGTPTTWDNNIARLEGGVGYHVTRELLAKFVVQTTNEGGGWTSDRTVPAVQISFSF